MGRESASSVPGDKAAASPGECNSSARAGSSGKPGGLGTECLWDVLSLPAPATCGSPFPSPLIQLQLPALLSTPVALSPGIFQTTWVEAFLHSPVCLVLPCQKPGSQNTPTFQSNHFQLP